MRYRFLPVLLASALFFASDLTGYFIPISGIADFRDGDSGHIGDTPFRLKCIDAPEYTSVSGIDAAKFVWDRYDGHSLTCYRRQRNRSHGRVVVSCKDAIGVVVNRAIVDAGYARYISPSCANEASRW